MDKALIHCKKLGIKLISNSPILNYAGKNRTDWPTAFVQHYIPTEVPIENLSPEEQEFQDALIALVGWQVKDEPLYYDWTKDYPYYYKKIENGKSSIILPDEVTPDDLELLGKETEPKLLKFDCGKILDNYDTIKKIDPDRLLFCNLAVDYKSKWIGNNRTYAQYLDEYISTFKPTVLSFDYYPIDDINVDGTTTHYLHDSTFYNNLIMFAEKSQQYNIPFWAYCLCLEHSTGEGGRDYPYPTEGMMRFEAFSALAFGAQGIVYWQYRLDDLNSGTSSSQSSQSRPTLNGGAQLGNVSSIGSSTDDKGVPVYGNGVTTSVWQSIQKINSDIIKENDKFFNCKLISYNLCFGNTDCHLHGEAGIDIIKSSGKGFLMTHIETPDPEKKDGNGNPVINKYIVIVSRDPFKSQELQWLYVQDPNSTVDKNICTPVFNNTGNYENDPWRKEILPPGGYHIFKC